MYIHEQRERNAIKKKVKGVHFRGKEKKFKRHDILIIERLSEKLFEKGIKKAFNLLYSKDMIKC